MYILYWLERGVVTGPPTKVMPSVSFNKPYEKTLLDLDLTEIWPWDAYLVVVTFDIGPPGMSEKENQRSMPSWEKYTDLNYNALLCGAHCIDSQWCFPSPRDGVWGVYQWVCAQNGGVVQGCRWLKRFYCHHMERDALKEVVNVKERRKGQSNAFSKVVLDLGRGLCSDFCWESGGVWFKMNI